MKSLCSDTTSSHAQSLPLSEHTEQHVTPSLSRSLCLSLSPASRHQASRRAPVMDIVSYQTLSRSPARSLKPLAALTFQQPMIRVSITGVQIWWAARASSTAQAHHARACPSDSLPSPSNPPLAPPNSFPPQPTIRCQRISLRPHRPKETQSQSAAAATKKIKHSLWADLT